MTVKKLIKDLSPFEGKEVVFSVSDRKNKNPYLRVFAKDVIEIFQQGNEVIITLEGESNEE